MMKRARLSLGFVVAALAIVASIAPGTGFATASADPGLDPASTDFRWHLLNPRPCVRDTVVLVVAGFEATPCDSFIEAFVREPAHVVYHTEVRDSVACPTVLPRIHPIPLPLGLFPSGPQTIVVEWVIDHRTPSGRLFTEVRRVPIDFYVSAECNVGGRLPFVDHVQIGPPNGRVPPCVPPGDSILVVIAGRFPSDCFSVRGIEVLPDLTLSPLPHSPGVRVTVDDGACYGRPCGPPVRWSASIKLPPLRPFEYKLPVEIARVSCSDTYPPGELFVAAFPFVVSERCRNALGCLTALFDPLGQRHECDARIGPGEPARLTLYLRSSVALSGLQGELELGDSALHVTRLAPSGPAQGMLLRWAPTPRGAKFALISDQGAPIPPASPGEPAPDVLAIAVEQGPGRPRSPVTLLRVDRLIAVDAEAREVMCAAMLGSVVPMPVVARICSAPGGACDFSGDGREDIRDLVLMMRCLREATLCGDSVERFDCNQDQAFTLDDVMCCAERILSNECPDCPPGETRDARDVKIAFGLPIGRAGSLDLPVRIEGTSGIGGARLALRFPDDRYEIRGVDFGGAAASWLHLSQVGEGRVVVGLIDPAAAPGTETEAVVTLSLALKSGRQPGGEVALESADFTAPDGVKLAAVVPQLRQPLGGTPRLALTESRPNPFTAATRFAVTLDRPGPVEVGIYDLFGRRLATLHRGELPAGTREFTWDGRLADGSRARDGVYFYRVAAGTETLARKLVLLRSR